MKKILFLVLSLGVGCASGNLTDLASALEQIAYEIKVEELGAERGAKKVKESLYALWGDPEEAPPSFEEMKAVVNQAAKNFKAKQLKTFFRVALYSIIASEKERNKKTIDYLLGMDDVKKLIDETESIPDYWLFVPKDKSLLFVAVEKNRSEAVKKLVKSGADVNVKSGEDVFPLIEALNKVDSENIKPSGWQNWKVGTAKNLIKEICASEKVSDEQKVAVENTIKAAWKHGTTEVYYARPKLWREFYTYVLKQLGATAKTIEEILPKSFRES